MEGKKLTPREKIAMGECQSPFTSEYCPYCIDRCDAFTWKHTVNSELNKNGIKP